MTPATMSTAELAGQADYAQCILGLPRPQRPRGWRTMHAELDRRT
jgi:hypothetical protein